MMVNKITPSIDYNQGWTFKNEKKYKNKNNTGSNTMLYMVQYG